MALEQVAPELATFARVGNVPQTAPVVDESSLNNPLFGMEPKDIAEWSVATKGSFSPKAFTAANYDLIRQRPELYEKLSEAHRILGERGFKVSDVDLKKAAAGTAHMLGGLVEAGGAYAEGLQRRGVGLPALTAPVAAAREIVQTKTKGGTFKEGLMRAGEAVLPRTVFKKLFKQDTPERKQAVEGFLSRVDAEQKQKDQEIVAGSETAATGLVDLARRGGRKLFGKDWGELSPEERNERFEMDVQLQRQIASTVQGEGALTTGVFGGKADVRPERVEKLAAGDPLSFLAFSGGIKAATGIPGAVVRRLPAARRIATAQAAGARAGQAASAATAAEGRAAAAAGQAGRLASEASAAGTPEAIAAAERAAQQATLAQGSANVARAAQGAIGREAQTAAQAVASSPASRAILGAQNAIRNIRGAVGGAVDRGAEALARGATGAAVAGAGTVAGATGLGIDFVRSFLAPIITPRALKVTASGLRRAGGAGMRTGADIATGRTANLGLVGQFVSDLSAGVGSTAAGAAKGFVPDLAFAALTSEEPADTAHMPLFMTAVGGLRGGARGARGVLSGQLLSPRERTMVGTEFGAAGRRQYGTSTALDQGNTFSLRGKDPRVIQRLGAIRSVVEQFGGEAYFIEDPQVFSSALRSLGVSQEQANFMAQQLGVRIDLPDRNGVMRPVVIVRELSAGPHEAGHAMQYFLSEDANNVLRQGAMDQFASQWDALGEQYVARLVGEAGMEPGRSWQEVLVERTGNPEGRDVIELANQRLADEIIAENFDTVMEARGPQLGQTKFQSILMGTLRVLGLDNVELGRSKEQDIPVTARSFESARRAGSLAATEAARPRFAGVGEPLRTGAVQRRPVVEPLGGEPTDTGGAPTPRPVSPARPPGGGALPRTPEERAGAIEDARRIVGEIRDPNEQAVATALADAMEAGEAVSVAYRAAPGEPAGAPGSTRAQRRAVIEAFRRMPESARSLWERMFFPERLHQMRDGRVQVIGWSPEVLAANAQKLAKTLADLSHRGVDIRRLSPYEVDVARGTFTEDGWNRLFGDAAVFSHNQLTGRTGAGETLVVPRSAQERGAFTPEVTGEATPLPQDVADFHNLLFNFRLPNTPRITGGRTPLNILGQDVAEATVPGRTRPTVEPRDPYTGEAAQALGIEGREIREVNPLRQEIEQAASAHGLKYPSMIEVIQRLNMDRIADAQAAPSMATVGRGNTLTLSAGFQPARRGRTAGLRSPDYFGVAGKLTAQGFKRYGVENPDMWNIYEDQNGNKLIVERGADRTWQANPITDAELAKFPSAPKRGGGAKADVSGAQFQARRVGAGDREFNALTETPRVGYGKHVWLDRDGNYFDAEGFHKEWAEKYTGLKGDEAMNKLLNEGWIRVNASPGLGIFVETGAGTGFNRAQTAALEDFAFGSKLPVLNRKGRVQISSTAQFQKDTGFVSFQAQRRGEKAWALPKSKGGDRMVKAWIMPNGEPVQLGGKWHHEYLNENADSLASQFKLSAKALKNGENDSRVEALKGGAVRINYNTSTGNVVIEATRKGWNRNKAAIETFVMENIEKFDSADVTIFDNNVKKIVDEDSASLFRFDGPERLQQFPLLFEEARVSAVGRAREEFGGLVEGVNFQPGRKRRIAGAAVRTKDGETFVGIDHGDAFLKAQERGYTERDIVDADSFVDDSGALLGRHEASLIARDADQVRNVDFTGWPKDKSFELDAAMLKGPRSKLIGGIFQPAKAAEGKETIKMAALRWKPTGEVTEGILHALAADEILVRGLADEMFGKKYRTMDELAEAGLWDQFMSQTESGYVTSKGRFVDRAEAVDIGQQSGQLDARALAKVQIRQERFGVKGLDSSEVPELRRAQIEAEQGGEMTSETIGRAHGDVQAQPGRRTGNRVAAEADRLKTEKLSTGFTNKAVEIGRNASPEELAAARAASDYYSELYSEAKGRKDFDAMMDLSMKRQFFNEIVGANERPADFALQAQPARTTGKRGKYGTEAERRLYNTNNAWGFGGSNGTEVVFDSGVVHRTGRLSYRHPYEGLPTKADYLQNALGERITPDRAQLIAKFYETLRPVLAGERDGITLDKTATEVTRFDGEPFDVVTIHSQNVKPAMLPSVLEHTANGPWSDFLDRSDTALGVFKVGDGEYSVDINAVVPKKHRANTTAFLKENDQIAGFDLEKFEPFEAGGTGKSPKITDETYAVDAVRALQEGRPFDFGSIEADFQPRRAAGKVTKDVKDVVLMPDAQVDVSVPSSKVESRRRSQSPEAKLTLADKFDRTGKESARWNDYLSKVVDSVGGIPGMRKIKGSLRSRYNQMVDHIADNLKFLYELSPKADRANHAQWYWKANGMSNRWAGEYGHEPRAVAAANAILSPQKDWYENVSMTRAVLDTLKADPVVKPEHVDYTEAVVSKRSREADRDAGMAMAARLRDNVGKKLSELDSELGAAVVRAETDLFTPRSIHDHDMNPIARTESGRKTYSWQKYNVIANALDVLRNPSVENINVKLGNNHKVRSFYNNHVNPQDSVALPITVDTHATAAGAMVPYGASSPEVKATFGIPKANEEGYYGTYPLWADAYRKAAADLGLDYPLELQSVTWERIRNLVSPARKRSLMKPVQVEGKTVDIEFPEVEAIWTQFEKGKITRRQAQEQLAALFKLPARTKDRELARNQLSLGLEE